MGSGALLKNISQRSIKNNIGHVTGHVSFKHFGSRSNHQSIGGILPRHRSQKKKA
jgi:hypothetical protein